jgi:tetratricopeptide (TPR) repeat protein
MQEHPSEDDLAIFAYNPAEMPNAAEIEAHVAACPRCSATLTTIQTVDAGLADPEVWDLAGGDDAATRAALLDLAATAAEEDEAAAALLAPLVENPARLAWANLAELRKYRTAGVVRRLASAANQECYREPLHALTLADTAIELAKRLSGYPQTVLFQLRGTAWKERANALRLLGRYDEALEALDTAEREFSVVGSDPLGMVMVRHARAIVHLDRGEYDSAGGLFTECAAIYLQVGETDQYMRARHAGANVLFRQKNVRAAQAIYEEILMWAEATNNQIWIARETNTVGRCAFERRDFARAEKYFERSIDGFNRLGLTAEVMRPRWNLAAVLLATGNAGEALTGLRTVREEFLRREMITDAALVALDIMDSLLALDRASQIADLAADVMSTFTRANMLTSALTAFAYLKESPRRRAAWNPARIDHVRRFLGRLERQPSLLFVPPEDDR